MCWAATLLFTYALAGALAATLEAKRILRGSSEIYFDSYDRTDIAIAGFFWPAFLLFWLKGPRQ